MCVHVIGSWYPGRRPSMRSNNNNKNASVSLQQRHPREMHEARKSVVRLLLTWVPGTFWSERVCVRVRAGSYCGRPTLKGRLCKPQKIYFVCACVSWYVGLWSFGTEVCVSQQLFRAVERPGRRFGFFLLLHHGLRWRSGGRRWGWGWSWSWGWG